MPSPKIPAAPAAPPPAPTPAMSPGRTPSSASPTLGGTFLTGGMSPPSSGALVSDTKPRKTLLGQ